MNNLNSNLNSLIIEGNIVNKAEVREPKPYFKVTTFIIAVNRFYKDGDGKEVNEVDYFDIECYGNMAQFAADKGEVGRGIRVVGRLKQSVWEDEEGEKHSKVFVVAEHIEYKPIVTKKESTNENSKIF